MFELSDEESPDESESVLFELPDEESEGEVESESSELPDEESEEPVLPEDELSVLSVFTGKSKVPAQLIGFSGAEGL